MISLSPQFIRFFAFIFIAGIFSSCSTLKKTNKEIETNLRTSTIFHKGFTGLAVYDPVEEEMLYEYNSEKYFTPASNTKLFTFYTGLNVLGDSVPALKYFSKNDSLIFKGMGDPSFLNPDLPASKVFEFLKNTGEELYYYPPVFTEKYFGPGWSWDDYNYAYSVERAVMPVYGNRVILKIDKNKQPEISPILFKDSIIISGNSQHNPGITRDISRNSFIVHKGNKEFTREVPFKYSDELMVELLQDTLKKKIKIIHELPANSEFDNTLYSIPTDSLYKRMLEVSDNFIAEQILLMAADKISDTLKSRIAIDYMKENHLKDLPDEPVWVDGSGLSRYNLFTPRTMVKLLEKIRKEVPQERLFNMMATGGKSGTLENYYKADTPYIFAKTGTLSNNHSLSGFLKTRSGKVLIFSFMNSNYTVPTSKLKEGMEIILKNIRDNY
ncbi:D-alanyl-D-alanine carboxypeptidase/D-alanyl-D-alanine-endopeptidase [Gramella jeungdoensis]|uniref:D-alanyl-D-alanine carboxypeptidase/D-alanyl-D-alanine-endopeptidase n=1 Tax=Gramella jeungdoensis TaxID=708091 RepID=A0ABT0YWQ9_9FLAO|nr:D-alanyl-D-alanine carboxypeptidase/D-alanyl-D-alanine-endopeptidase [Gramella jeungdoensis]MCM8567887.1 D-alanyl-D-alanine carboxypeptidase/D-alanyl-D-alanine-endopeptidase [Gramella jeungdoensis]